MKVVIFGKTPPPIGGVTKSVENLILSLKSKDIDTYLLDNPFKFIDLLSIRKKSIVHSHFSSPIKRFFSVVLGRFLFHRIIYTVHGSNYTTTGFMGFLNRQSALISDGVIVLNNEVLNKIRNIGFNVKYLKITSILKEGFIDSEANDDFFNRRQGVKYILAYAYKKNYNNKGEVYGINFLLRNLDALPNNTIIVIHDLNGEYQADIEEALLSHPQRIIYLKGELDFLSLLRNVDIYVRPTAMDGSSVAVIEAVMLGVPVLASDVVDRPAGVITYRYLDAGDFIKKLIAIEKQKPKQGSVIDSVDGYISFLESL